MSQPYSSSFQLEDDFEEIPNQFQENKQTPFSYYNSSKLHSNITLNKTHQKGIKKSQITQYLQKAEHYIQTKTQKISLLKNQEENRIMNDCTFQPSVNKSRSKSARNIKQFLDSQQKHLEKIEEKKEVLKQRIEKQNRKNLTFSPTINNSKSNKNKENVHERLYKQKDKEEKPENYYETYSHVPKITARGEKMARNMPVGELLYQDAKRRADKQHQLPQTEQRVFQKNHIQQKYAAQKFLKDYKNALQQTNLQQKTEYSQQEFVSIMSQLGYARYLANQNHSLFQEQKKLLQDCFSYLEQAGVTQINVYVFLLALGGIYNIDLNNEEITGVLIIQEDEGKKIHQYFDLLFRNRLFADVSSKKEVKTHVKQENNFKPAINPESLLMAERHRTKMIVKANSIFSKNNIDIQISEKGISHEDLLVICNLGQNLQKEKMRQKKMQEIDPQCTFQPNSQKYCLQFSNNNVGKDKCKELYQNAKAKHQQIQKLAIFKSFQQKKHLKSGSVSPRPYNKNNHSISKSNIKSYLEIKDVDKTLARMVAGRQQRNQRRQFEQRGEKVAKKAEQKPKKVENQSCEKELLLDADIMVNSTKKKIYIYKGQQSKVKLIVQKFAIQCDLDQQSKNILYEKLLQSVNCLKLEENSIIDQSF